MRQNGLYHIGTLCQALFCTLLFSSAQAGVTLKVTHPGGTGETTSATYAGLPPLAVPMTVSRTESTHRFERNQAAPNVDATSGTYRWTNVTTANVFCVELAAGGDPSLTQPTNVLMDGLIARNSNTVANLKQGAWWYGDDGLGFSSVCVQTVGNEDPDTDPRDIWLIYGQGGKFAPVATVSGEITFTKRTDLEFTDATGALGVSDGSSPWLLYGFQTGDYFQLQHASVNSGNPIWVSVTSKTSKDAIVIDGAFHNDDLTGVTCFFPIQSEYGDMDVTWAVIGGNARTFTLNTDTRPNAYSTTIPTTLWRGPQFTPVMDGNGTVVVEIQDYRNGESDTFTMTVDTDDNTWDGTNLYISATGDDTGGNDCTNSGTPCQSLANGITKLIAAGARSSLFVKLGDTDIPMVSATVTAFPAYSSSTDKRITTTGSFGSGGYPEFIAYSNNDVPFEMNSSSANLRVENLSFPAHGGAPALFDWKGSNLLISRVSVTRTGGGAIVSTSSADTQWNTIHDCRLVHNGSFNTAFLSTGETAPEASQGLSIIGSYIYNNSGEHALRVYPANMLIAYNHVHHNRNANGAGVPIRLTNTSGRIDLDFRAVLYNYVRAGQTPDNIGTPCIMTSETSGGAPGGQNDVVIEGNYCLQEDTTSGQARGVSLENGSRFYIRNNVFNQCNFAIEVTDNSVTTVCIENNTSYISISGTKQFFRRFNGTNLVRHLLIVNNAIEGCSTNCIEQTLSSGTLDARPFTHVFNNNFNVGTATHIRIRTGAANASYSVDATGTAWTSVRPGQTNYGGDGVNAVDCDFVNEAVGNFELNIGSPCIDAGVTTYPIIVDHRGNSKTSGSAYDIGAMEFNTGAAVGTCCACDNSCTDTQQAACEATPGSIWTTTETCAVEGCSLTTGACCVAGSGTCSVITDACCEETQWLTGAACTACEWQCCQSDGTCTDETSAVCSAFTNEVFTAGAVCSGDCTTVACCDGETCADLTVFACTALGFTSAGADTNCGTGSPCAAPSGSCCATDGSCAVTSEAACTGTSTWLEDGTCTPNLCDPAWACCGEDGSCTTLTDTACTTASGDWQEDVACTGGLCLIRACCEIEDCTDTIESDCAFVWHPTMTCSELPCVVGGLGSCCDYRLGNCEDDLEEEECAGTTQLWMEGGTCVLDPCVESDIVTNGTVPAGTTIIYPETTIRPGAQAGRWVFEPHVNLAWLTNASGQAIYAKINGDIDDEASAESGDYTVKIPTGMMAEVTRGGTRKVHVLSVWVPTSGDRDGVGVSVDWRKPNP